jgi:hypothetical protein
MDLPPDSDTIVVVAPRAELTLTSKRSAASRRDAPVSTASIMRSRRSQEWAFGIASAPVKENQCTKIRPFIIFWESPRFKSDGNRFSDRPRASLSSAGSPIVLAARTRWRSCSRSARERIGGWVHSAARSRSHREPVSPQQSDRRVQAPLLVRRHGRRGICSLFGGNVGLHLVGRIGTGSGGVRWVHLGNDRLSHREFELGVPEEPTVRNVVIFWIVTLFGLMLNLILAYSLERLAFRPFSTILVIFVTVPILNYIGNCFWTFWEPPATAEGGLERQR